MSTPHIAWAFAQRDLTAAQRVVLIALAERANGERTCFPSEETLARDCELSLRSIAAAVKYLAGQGRDDARRLIEIVSNKAERAAILAKAGASISARVNVYRILRPVDGAKNAPTNGHDSAKSASIPRDSAKSARQTPSDSAKSSNQSCKKQQFEHAPFAHESLNESLHEKKRQPQEEKPTDVRGSSAASGARPQQPKQAAQEAQQAPPTEPDEEPRANFESAHQSVVAALSALGATYRPRADSPTLPPMPRLPPQQRISPAETQAEPVPNAQRMEALNIVGKLGRRLGHREYAQGRGPALTPAEQIAAAQAPPTITDIHPAVLPAVLAARRDLIERARQRMAVHA